MRRLHKKIFHIIYKEDNKIFFIYPLHFLKPAIKFLLFFNPILVISNVYFQIFSKKIR